MAKLYAKTDRPTMTAKQIRATLDAHKRQGMSETQALVTYLHETANYNLNQIGRLMGVNQHEVQTILRASHEVRNLYVERVAVGLAH